MNKYKLYEVLSQEEGCIVMIHRNNFILKIEPK